MYAARQAVSEISVRLSFGVLDSKLEKTVMYYIIVLFEYNIRPCMYLCILRPVVISLSTPRPGLVISVTIHFIGAQRAFSACYTPH